MVKSKLKYQTEIRQGIRQEDNHKVKVHRG